jgi:hypothetical protein
MSLANFILVRDEFRPTLRLHHFRTTSINSDDDSSNSISSGSLAALPRTDALTLPAEPTFNVASMKAAIKAQVAIETESLKQEIHSVKKSQRSDSAMLQKMQERLDGQDSKLTSLSSKLDNGINHLSGLILSITGRLGQGGAGTEDRANTGPSANSTSARVSTPVQPSGAEVPMSTPFQHSGAGTGMPMSPPFSNSRAGTEVPMSTPFQHLGDWTQVPISNQTTTPTSFPYGSRSVPTGNRNKRQRAIIDQAFDQFFSSSSHFNMNVANLQFAKKIMDAGLEDAEGI